MTLEIPDRVRRRALTLDEAGAAWLAGLDDLVRDLAAAWRLTVEQPLAGGTESFVATVRTTDGEDAVLKITLPGLDPRASELRTLLAAGGRGYVRVLRHDSARGVMLLERLGPQLAELGLSVDAQVEAICGALREAWMPLPAGARFMTGAEKAQDLSDFITRSWRELGAPCAERIIDIACRFAEERRRAFDPATAILGHGDPHPWNTLVVSGDGPRRYRFVDPDGLFIERAYDLAILMRELSADLQSGDPLLRGRHRCDRLARLIGVAPEPIWQWALVERTSTGLLLLRLGLDDLARDFFAIAEAWAADAG